MNGDSSLMLPIGMRGTFLVTFYFLFSIELSVSKLFYKGVCVASCQRSPEPVFLTWKEVETVEGGDFFVRSGPGTVKLSPDDTGEYIRTRFPDREP